MWNGGDGLGSRPLCVGVAGSQVGKCLRPYRVQLVEAAGPLGIGNLDYQILEFGPKSQVFTLSKF